MRRTRVKVCGITCREDAVAAIDAGVDALGFNSWPGSKRFINLRDASSWIAELPCFVSRVVVMVNPTFAEVCSLSKESWVDAIQLHGRETASFCRELNAAGVRVLKALPAAEGVSADAPIEYGTADVLIDTWGPDAFGGTGRELDLNYAERFLAAYPALRVTIAGGLTPANIMRILRRISPFAVDVAGGVEKDGDPRRKDPAKILAFMEAVAAVEKGD